MKTCFAVKYLIMFAFTFLLFSGIANSQVIVVLEHPPLNQLKTEDLWKIQLTNTTQKTLSVFLEGNITKDGAEKIVEATCAQFTLKPGITKLRTNDLKDISLNYSNKQYEEMLLRTGTVKEGNYEICVSVINAQDKMELGKGCITQNVMHMNPPELVSPENNKSFSEANAANIVFQWLPPMPTPSGGGLSYTIKIVEVLPNQSPETAIQNNNVWFQKGGITATLFNYPLSAPKLRGGKTYGWQISLKDQAGKIVGEPSSVSCVIVLSSEDDDWVYSKTAPRLISPENNKSFSEAETANIIFQWLGPKPEPIDEPTLKYTLKIVEVLQNQTPEAALQNNPIFYQKENIPSTSFKYPVSAPKLRSGKTYGWQISLKDQAGKIVGEPSSVSCVIVLSSEDDDWVYSKTAPKLISPADNDTTHVSRANHKIEFRWEPPSKKPNIDFTYSIKVVAKEKDQSLEEAIMKNQPIFKSDGLNGTTYIGRFSSEGITVLRNALSNINDSYRGVHLAWQITMKDRNGINLGMSMIADGLVLVLTTDDYPDPDLDGEEEESMPPPRLASPKDNEAIKIKLSEIKTKVIEFIWEAPRKKTNVDFTYTLKIVPIEKKQSITEAMKINKPLLEKNKITDTKISLPDLCQKLENGKTYAWCVIMMIAGKTISSDIWKFNFSTLAVEETACSWPTLTDEFPVKSDNMNEYLSLWPSGIADPCYIIPGRTADCVWGRAIFCLSLYDCIPSSPWPPASPSCPWHILYQRGSCWIARQSGSWGRWDSAWTSINHIIRRNFELTQHVTDVKIYIAADDEVEVYLDPTDNPLNTSNSGYIATHIGFSSVATFNLPELSSGNHKLVFLLKNTRAQFMGFIYGVEYTPSTSPPIIEFRSPESEICYGDLTAGEIEFSAIISAADYTLDSRCISLTLSSTEGITGSVTYNSDELSIEDIGVGGGGHRFLVKKRLNAKTLFESVIGTDRICGTITASFSAGNDGCTSFTTASRNILLDLDNQTPIINFISPVLTPATLYFWLRHSPTTDPTPLYDRFSESGHCTPLPLPETIQIDLLWASGLTTDNVSLSVRFDRQEKTYATDGITIIDVHDSFYYIPSELLHDHFTLTSIPNGKRLTLDPSVIFGLLPSGIILQECDKLTFSFHFPDKPCVCPESFFQKAIKINLTCNPCDH